MSFGEAYRLAQTLAADPTSAVAAAVAGWERPTSHAELVLMDLIDLTNLIAWSKAGGKGKRPKAYPRPWPSVRGSGRTKPAVSQEAVLEALRFAGHTKPLPVKG